MSGSDPALLAEMAAFFVAFDAAATEEERQELLRVWLLDHGARYEDPEKRRWYQGLVGGIYPVRL